MSRHCRPSWFRNKTVADVPLKTALKENYSLEHVIREHSWKSTWLKIGTIGKQVLLQQLFDVMNCRTGHPGSTSFSDDDKLKAEGILSELLAMADDEESEQHHSELKASITHRLMISAAFALRKSPTRNITTVALKTIYGCVDDRTWTLLGNQWKAAAGEARFAVFWAARVLHIVRSHHCTHFTTPVNILRSVLILWLYSILFEQADGISLDPAPGHSIVLGPGNLQSTGTMDWIQNGNGSVKLQGIGNLSSARGRCKLLDEAIPLMKALKCWSISSSYSQLFIRLRANERPEPDDRANDSPSQ